MNREELRDNYKEKGWRVPTTDKWVFDREEEIKGKMCKFYNVDVQSPDKGVGIAQVGVINEDQTNEEGRNIESAKPFEWEREIIPFEQALRDFLDAKETALNTVFAINVIDIKELDEVATVMVYTNSNNDITGNTYVVKRRDNEFSFKKLIS